MLNELGNVQSAATGELPGIRVEFNVATPAAGQAGVITALFSKRVRA